MNTKKINLRLVGLDGNAFSLLSAFSRQAKREGWTQEEIADVMNQAQEGDYNNLIKVLSSYCVDGGL